MPNAESKSDLRPPGSRQRGRLGQQAAEATECPRLTCRQEEVLTLVAVGLTAPQIAAALGISTRTARAHTDALKHKLGVSRSREIPLAYRLRTNLDPVILTGLLELVGVVIS